MTTTAALANHQVRLARRPSGRAHPRRTGASPPSRWPQPADGGVLVKTLALSLDPAMRGWMNEGKSYIPPVGIGEVMRAGGIGKVDRLEEPGVRGRRPGVRHAGRAGVRAGRRGTRAAQRPVQDRPAAGQRRRSGSTCSACRA